MLSATHMAMGGIAWFAHIGGFITGMVLVRLMRAK
jgi:membrane associated rhomboid family serine protease